VRTLRELCEKTWHFWHLISYIRYEVRLTGNDKVSRDPARVRNRKQSGVNLDQTLWNVSADFRFHFTLSFLASFQKIIEQPPTFNHVRPFTFTKKKVTILNESFCVHAQGIPNLTASLIRKPQPSRRVTDTEFCCVIIVLICVWRVSKSYTESESKSI